MGRREQTTKPSGGLIGFVFRSPAAVFLIVLNVAAFAVLQYTAFGQTYISELIVFPGNLIKGNFWCLFTSGFVHVNTMHLALNMLGIFVFAYIVEQHMGWAKTVFIYIGALLVSMLGSTMIYALVMHRNVAIVGASGAVMGLMGAAVLLAPFSVTFEMLLPLPTMVKGWLFLWADLKGFLGGESGGTSHLAHLTGFASIVLLMYFLAKDDRRKMTVGFAINLVSLAVVVWAKQRFFP